MLWATCECRIFFLVIVKSTTQTYKCFFKIGKMALSAWKSTRKGRNAKILILLTYCSFRHLIKISSGWKSQVQTIFFPVCYHMHWIEVPCFAQLYRTVCHQLLTYHCRAAKLPARSVIVLHVLWDIWKLMFTYSLLWILNRFHGLTTETIDGNYQWVLLGGVTGKTMKLTLSASSKNISIYFYYFTELQNHRMIGVGGNLLRSSSPTLLIE